MLISTRRIMMQPRAQVQLSYQNIFLLLCVPQGKLSASLTRFFFSSFNKLTIPTCNAQFWTYFENNKFAKSLFHFYNTRNGWVYLRQI